MSGNEQICIVGQSTKRHIIFQAIDISNKPIPNLPITYEVVFPTDESKNDVIVDPENDKMTTDESGYFKAKVTVGKKEGKYALLFYTEEEQKKFSFIEIVINAKRKSWGNWMLFWLFGAMGLLVLGMKISSDGLMKLAGAKMRKVISTMTSNPVWGLGSGAAMTVFTQSSSATSSILVNLVKSGLLSLRQAIPVLFGAAIGTTVIVQIISFNITDFALPMIAIGVIFILISKNKSTESVGEIIVGFGLIFFSMFQMQQIIAPLKEFQFFSNAVQAVAGSKGWCLIISALFTALCHSSGATLGITISLGAHGFINLDTAIPIIFGANIGTTATAIMVSIGTTPDAKRVAWAHLIFKTCGVIVCFPLVNQIADLSKFITKFLSEIPLPLGANTIPRQIANTHTLINCFWGVIFLPFVGILENITKRIIPETETPQEREIQTKYLSLNIDDSPTSAIGSSIREISRMGRFVEEMMRIVGDSLFERKENLASLIETKEGKVDALRFSITQYLIDLTRKNLSPQETKSIIKLIFIVSDLENIGDIIIRNMLPLAQKMILNDRHFSEEGAKELKDLHKTVSEELSKIIIALTTKEITLAKTVADNRKPIFKQADLLHLSHIRRFREGLQDSLDTSTIHLDLINYLMRIEYFVSSIASLVSEHPNRVLEIDMQNGSSTE